MRVRSDIFVSALIRRVFSAGGFAAVEHKGSPEAGAIAIRQLKRDGTETLFMPAPQSFMEEGDVDRLFEVRKDDAASFEVSEALEKELKFDSDLWVVALETETVEGLFALAEE
ncbi:DUF1491 family protein [Martelella endophytica]|uniref:DUF1491 family protein n=1 Tax=Martelella endophytica TaxID=1486262 RepID=A0A0D5LWK9_MAREN|nr:DUF1491 family protein [Martelella endophytica]AJY48345.1 hypothetical protein TM49_18680 [Martelella endophytica]